MPLFPQIVVVWVGTNNHDHTAEQVTGGIKAIVQLVNQRQPQARVVVLVRGWETWKGRMAVVRDLLDVTQLTQFLATCGSLLHP